MGAGSSLSASIQTRPTAVQPAMKDMTSDGQLRPWFWRAARFAAACSAPRSAGCLQRRSCAGKSESGSNGLSSFSKPSPTALMVANLVDELSAGHEPTGVSLATLDSCRILRKALKEIRGWQSPNLSRPSTLPTNGLSSPTVEPSCSSAAPLGITLLAETMSRSWRTTVSYTHLTLPTKA